MVANITKWLLLEIVFINSFFIQDLDEPVNSSFYATGDLNTNIEVGKLEDAQEQQVKFASYHVSSNVPRIRGAHCRRNHWHRARHCSIVHITPPPPPRLLNPGTDFIKMSTFHNSNKCTNFNLTGTIRLKNIMRFIYYSSIEF